MTLNAGQLAIVLTAIEEQAKAARVNIVQAANLAQAAGEPQNALHLTGEPSSVTPATQMIQASEQHTNLAMRMMQGLLHSTDQLRRAMEAGQPHG